ncbi:MAG: hypothetical protein JXQ68_04070 [Campylobacterales bacterium]|nr:hypothetical protein [Campylobacterales bacterium]
MMTMIDKRIINALLIVDIGVVVFCYLFGTRTWLINSQIGFVSSLLVVLASMHSYSKMVQRQVENAKPLDNEDDVLEKIEDPHEVFREDAESQEEDSRKEPKISVLESLKNSRASISFYRIGAYGVFALGFLYLSSNKIFHISSYFVGISLPIAVIVTLLFLKAKKGDV